MGVSVVGTKINSQVLNDNFSSLAAADISTQAEFDKRGISVEKYANLVVGVDWSAAIQAAIDAVAAQGGGIVRLYDSTYETNSPLNLKSNVKLVGVGAKATVIKFNGTGTALFIQGVVGAPKEWMGLSNLMISAPNVTNAPVILMDAAYYVEFSDVNVFGNSAAIKVGSIGIHIKGTNTGYYGTFSRTQFAFFDKGAKLEDSANANRFIASWFFGCNIGMEIIDSNGNLIQGVTFQDFNKKGIFFNDSGASRTRNNTVIGCYFEPLAGLSTIECAIETNPTSKTLHLYGNLYNGLRPTYPELIDNGQFTTRMEWMGASYNEPMKQGAFMTLPKFDETTPPAPGSAFRGSLFYTTEALKQDKLRAVMLDKDGANRNVEIPFIVNGSIYYPSSTVFINGKIQQWNDGDIQVGTLSDPTERHFRYDTGFKRLQYHDGTAFRFIPNVLSGTTANRPTGAVVLVGTEYFDTTLGKPVWCKANASGTPTWVDATGATV